MNPNCDTELYLGTLKYVSLIIQGQFLRRENCEKDTICSQAVFCTKIKVRFLQNASFRL